MAEAEAPRPPSGHRARPEAAETRIEAWAPTREQCVAEAVLALVESFADTGGARPTGAFPFQVGGASDEDMLAAVMDEVLFLLDAAAEVPIDAEVEEADGGLDVRLTLTEEVAVTVTGPVPYNARVRDVEFGRGHDAAGGWSCRVLLEPSET
jgi:SHS2 domain-containing protein